MILRKLTQIFLVCSAFAIVLFPQIVSACATCFGQSDSKLAQGMNMGIFSLLGVVFCVLGGIAAFFIHLARRSRTIPPPPLAGAPLETLKNTF